MRDLKFRCYYDNKMHKVLSLDFSYKKINLLGADIINFGDGKIMQYTGLKDKNGNEIFEGDIVQAIYFNNSKSKKYVVKYDTDRAGFIPFACGDGCGCCETDVISVAYAEVIGNIYDNPELLKGEQS